MQSAQDHPGKSVRTETSLSAPATKLLPVEQDLASRRRPSTSPPSKVSSSSADPYSPSTPAEEQTSYEKIADALVASGQGNVEAPLHVLQLKSKALSETARTQGWDVSRILTSIRRRTPVPAGATTISQRPAKSATDPALAAAVCDSGAVSKDADLGSGNKIEVNSAVRDPLELRTASGMSSGLSSSQSSPSLVSPKKKSGLPYGFTRVGQTHL